MKRLSFIVFALVLVGCSSEPIDEPLVDPGAIDNTDNTSELEKVDFKHDLFFKNTNNDFEDWISWRNQVQNLFIENKINVADFIWSAMNIWYYWKDETPELTTENITNLQLYYDLLNSYSSPESFFNSLKNDKDRFSFYRANVEDLNNLLNGISLNDGLEFGLVANDQGDVIIYTKYVAKGSDAETKGVFRGDLFNRINGVRLTLDNYREVISNRGDSYVLGKVTQDENYSFLELEDEIELNPEEDFEEIPILFKSIDSFNGKKVGYIVYNQFISSYNTALNEVFSEFKASQIEELIVDLRYNPGGSTQSAAVLASLIHNGDGLFAKQNWNDFWQGIFSNSVSEFFIDELPNNGGTLNRLNLKRVYFLTQTGTASASELLINGLKPYMDVIQIGLKTTGKNDFSITLVDDHDNYFLPTYIQENQRRIIDLSVIDPNNYFAIQPIVGIYENSLGFSDYDNGIEPQIIYPEVSRIDNQISFNIGSFGSLEDGLFAQAIAHMNGGLTNQRAARSLGEPAEDLRPSEALMFVEF